MPHKQILVGCDAALLAWRFFTDISSTTASDPRLGNSASTYTNQLLPRTSYLSLMLLIMPAKCQLCRGSQIIESLFSFSLLTLVIFSVLCWETTVGTTKATAPIKSLRLPIVEHLFARLSANPIQLHTPPIV